MAAVVTPAREARLCSRVRGTQPEVAQMRDNEIVLPKEGDCRGGRKAITLGSQ